MEQTTQISKDMLVADVIAEYPLAAEIMESHGLTCTGCSVNTVESIELGAKSHGISDQVIDDMVKEINDAISSGKATRREAPAAATVEPLKVTPQAAAKMKSILKDQGKEGWGIRMQASAGGCAGFMYGMDFAETPQEGDQVQEVDGVKVFVDPQSAKLLSGVTVEYVETLNEQGFKFDNPNATSSCGCGKSFS